MTPAQPTSDRPPATVPLYGRWEWSLTADATPTANFVVRFTAPSGRSFVRFGYWDGANTWRVRFMPTEVGRWSYHKIYLALGDVPHERKGKFDCVAADVAQTRFERHGPLRVAASGHWLEHADGLPFLYVADTAWNGALLSDEREWDAYLDDRVAKGFTAIQFVTHAPWLGAYSNAEGEVAYTGQSRFPMNPHFFRRIDRRIDAINARGLLAVPVLLWAAPFGDTRLNAGVALRERQRVALAGYQVARYGANHVLWVLAGDGAYGGWLQSRQWKRVGRAVFGDAVSSAPVALHPAGHRWPYGAFAGEWWLGVLGYQSSHSTDARTLRWLQAGPPSRPPSPVRPVINLEPCYEGIAQGRAGGTITAADVRRATYWSILNAPPAGVAYGAHGVWSWERAVREPLNHPGTGKAQPWHVAAQLPGAAHVGQLARLLASVRWWELRPAGHLLASQPGESDPARFIAVAQSTSRDLTLCFLPAGGEIVFRPGAVPAGGRAEWFDPRSGEHRAADRQRVDCFAAPDAQDWVLLVQAMQSP